MYVDTLLIRSLQCRTVIGIHPTERTHEQRVDFDIELDYLFHHRVNYEHLVHSVRTFVIVQRLFLLEELAECVVGFIFDTFDSIQEIRLTATKHCVLLPDVLPSIRIRRQRPI